MKDRNWSSWSPPTGLLVLFLASCPVLACCPAPPSGKPVVNADQTVIILWDADSKTEHLIRQASFKSDADDFGFLVPTPSQPDLAESGNDAFPYLRKLTEPEIRQAPRPSGGINCMCQPAATAPPGTKDSVRVLETKLVAGFDAVVLETKSADDLVQWLKEHGYAFSPEVEAWAKPYVENGWKITALKVAKEKDRMDKPAVTASSLRISFQTDRPLFPYREPDSAKSAAALGAKDRLLRIYFLADARYQGDLTKEAPWKSTVAWADQLSTQDRKKLLELLKLPENTGPVNWQLTEFEHHWPYTVAAGDLFFSRSADQAPVKRPPITYYVRTVWPTDVMVYAIGAFLVVPPLWRRVRRGPRREVERTCS